eukprot:3707900-Rhodomonas_salina.2
MARQRPQHTGLRPRSRQPSIIIALPVPAPNQTNAATRRISAQCVPRVWFLVYESGACLPLTRAPWDQSESDTRRLNRAGGCVAVTWSGSSG